MDAASTHSKGVVRLPCQKRLGDLDDRRARLRRRRALLLLLAGACIALFIGATVMQLANPPSRLDGADVDKQGRLSFQHPRFFGRSNDGVQIEVLARAAQRAPEGNIAPITLSGPAMTGSDGTRAQAPEGFWEEAANRLVLRGGINVRLPNGEEVAADEMRWEPVRGAAPATTQDMRSQAAAAQLIMSGHILLRHMGATGLDEMHAQQAIWDFGSQTLTLYGAEGAGAGDSMVAPTAVWNASAQLLTLSDGAYWARKGVAEIRANQIAWDVATNQASMRGNVHMAMRMYQVSSDVAHADFTHRRMEGSGHATIIGPLGSAHANSYAYDGVSGGLRLSGGARVRTQLRH